MLHDPLTRILLIGSDRELASLREKSYQLYHCGAHSLGTERKEILAFGPQIAILILDHFDAWEELQQIISPNQTFLRTNLLEEAPTWPYQILPQGSLVEFLQDNGQYFFTGQYGEARSIKETWIHPSYRGPLEYLGSACLKAEFDQEEWLPFLSWTQVIAVRHDEPIEISLEFECHDTLSLALEILQIELGSYDKLLSKQVIPLQPGKLIQLCSYPPNGYYSLSLMVKGKGQLQVGNLYQRFSRGPWGAFLLGGQRLVVAGQELFTYFNPGKKRGPLMVYFSGYKTRNGFEAFPLFESLGNPFLLITDGRLEGGGFYLGQAYQQAIEQTIQKCLKQLGYPSHAFILSGLSMGTRGAIMAAKNLSPQAVILGKPLLFVRKIAENMRYLRPDDFYTSLDLLPYLDEEEQEAIDLRKWFGKGIHWSLMAMRHDDYDPAAGPYMEQALAKAGESYQVRYLDGRHNDQTSRVIDWFVKELKAQGGKDVEHA